MLVGNATSRCDRTLHINKALFNPDIPLFPPAVFALCSCSWHQA